MGEKWHAARCVPEDAVVYLYYFIYQCASSDIFKMFRVLHEYVYTHHGKPFAYPVLCGPGPQISAESLDHQRPDKANMRPLCSASMGDQTRNPTP